MYPILVVLCLGVPCIRCSRYLFRVWGDVLKNKKSHHLIFLIVSTAVRLSPRQSFVSPPVVLSTSSPRPSSLFDVIQQPSSSMSLLHGFAKTSPIFLHRLSMPSLSIPVTSYLCPQFMVLAKSLPLRFRLLFHSSIPPCISHFCQRNLASLSPITTSIPILGITLRLHIRCHLAALPALFVISASSFASPGFVVGLLVCSWFFVLCRWKMVLTRSLDCRREVLSQIVGLQLRSPIRRYFSSHVSF
jgi:hypothetical protein